MNNLQYGDRMTEPYENYRFVAWDHSGDRMLVVPNGDWEAMQYNNSPLSTFVRYVTAPLATVRKAS